MSSQRSTISLGLGLVAGFASLAVAAPCDIYGNAGTPCQAAHSTTRSLFGNFDGNLYQVTRASDGTTQDIGVISAGGFADSSAQDTFCSGTSCTISTIYDQTSNGNDLTAAPVGGATPGGPAFDAQADATAAPVTLNGGAKAYGVYFNGGMGYRNDATTGIATGDDSEGIYAVVDGTHSNAPCCFDYGNAETNNDDDGAGTMEALYFGLGQEWGNNGEGSGPWVLVDMENGLYSMGQSGPQGSPSVNENQPTINTRFVTGMIKGGQNVFSVKQGDSTTGTVDSVYSGARPPAYATMNKQGAIILGIGGDNSDGGIGTFYEGVLTSGYPTDDTENMVAADIANVGYAASS